MRGVGLTQPSRTELNGQLEQSNVCVKLYDFSEWTVESVIKR